MIARCLKILLLVSLVPLALRATSLLGGHVAPPCSSETSRPELQPRSGGGGVPASSHQRNRRRMEGALAALDSRRFRQHGGGGLEADKRLAPTGSNPLHNLR
ncbi:hypothetical protein E2562_034827 [Oryza meyeriana var. granulata]|uniref:Uncharacterized protein n=1 Tax=Oryza meyeriana var. granulata TaxID=110450 RepID=A0A6G1E7E9_9ORYZ|nr:hypothetical protein E2562_034827 [Oryza meyeriana var. granulata]